MPRTLAFCAICALSLAGCVAPQPTPVTTTVIRENPKADLQHWFAMEGHVAGMSADDAVASLVDIDRPQTPDMLFLYALLNQRLGSYGGLTQARDALQALEADASLLEEQRQLAKILRRYNQNRINSYLNARTAKKTAEDLQTQLQEAQEQRIALEQKIQALTDLETDISTRKGESPGAGSITPR